MNAAAIRRLRSRLRAGEATLGLWVTFECPSISEIASAMGLDWVVLDAEHGHMDWRDLVGHLRAFTRSDTVCLIRVADNDVALIKRALDIGADGVVVPWMETYEDLERAVAAARYPTRGKRGIGAERATVWGRAFVEHVDESDQAIVMPLIESVTGGANAAQLAEHPDVDIAFVGPADWCATAGGAGAWDVPGVGEGIAQCVEAWRSRGKHVGVVTTSGADLRARQGQGFNLLGIGLDGALLIGAIEGRMLAAGRHNKLHTNLTPEPQGTADNPLAAIPPALQSGLAAEVIDATAAPRIPLDDRSVVHALVGGHGRSRELCTALVHFEPGGGLVRHTHPTAETVVVVQGTMLTEVEGRRYTLQPGDGITIPAGAAHQTLNADQKRPAVIHVTMPTNSITREVVPPAVRMRDMPADSTGKPGAEHVVRAQAGASPILHAGRGMPVSGMQVQHVRSAGSRSGAASVSAVDRSLVVWRGQVRCRTDRLRVVLEAEQAVHIPPGVPFQMEWSSGDAEYLLTRADATTTDLRVAERLLTDEPLPASEPAGAGKRTSSASANGGASSPAANGSSARRGGGAESDADQAADRTRSSSR